MEPQGTTVPGNTSKATGNTVSSAGKQTSGGLSASGSASAGTTAQPTSKPSSTSSQGGATATPSPATSSKGTGKTASGTVALSGGVTAPSPATSSKGTLTAVGAVIAGGISNVTKAISPIPTNALAVANSLLSRSGKEELAGQIAGEYGIPANLFKGLITQESQWNLYALSGAGAVGLAQIMPKTGIGLGVNIHDPVENMTGGAKYLSQLYGKYGNWTDALSAYNFGPGNYDKYLAGDKPLPKETADYPGKVMAYANGYGGLEPVPAANAALTAIDESTPTTAWNLFKRTGQVPLPGPSNALTPIYDEPTITADIAASHVSSAEPLLKRTVKTIRIDPETNQPIVDIPGASSPKNASGSPNDRAPLPTDISSWWQKAMPTPEAPAMQKTRTIYVAPDGTEREVPQAGETPIPAGVTPLSVAKSWWEKALGRPPSNITAKGELSASGAIDNSASLSGTATLAATRTPLSITVPGGQLMSTGDFTSGNIDAGSDQSSDVVLSGTPQGIPSEASPVFFPDMPNFFYGSSPPTSINVQSSGSTGGGGGVVGTNAPHHNPLTNPFIAPDPFDPQYFNLDDFLGLLGKAGTGSSGSGGGGAAGISPLVIIGGLVAAGAAFYFMRHKHG